MRNQSALPDNDPVQMTLVSLRSDVERTPLADSLSVRRRGEARSRHQAVAGALVIAALVAGAFGVADLRGHQRHSGIPAHQSPSPTASVAIFTLAANPFLRDGDITAIGPYGELLDSGTEPQNKVQQCIDVSASATGASIRSTTLYEKKLGEVQAAEHVLRFDSAAEAEQYWARLSSAADACGHGNPAEVTTNDRGPEEVPPDSYRWSRLSTPTAAAGIGYYELGATHHANVVVVLEWSSMGNPTGDNAGWVWDADRLQLAVDRAIT
ncbi:MAG TPA: hypothetical protein VH857_08360 [Actinomycetes bacterium]|jgi:hypothetical protein|nr:hypothetical protein [Actinomycetes bacterium]